MIYITIFIIIATLAIFNTGFKKKSQLDFIFITSIITAISIFRYGSGTDYFAYMWHYRMNPEGLFKSIEYESNMNVGYRSIMGIAKTFGLSFETFVSILAIIVMCFFIYTIKNNSKRPIISLLIFYGIYYQIYVNSALRQGFAMSVFFWSFFRYYKEGKTNKYIFSIIIASLFHYSVLIALVIPLLKLMYNRYFKNYRVNVSLFMLGICSLILGGERVLVNLANIFGIVIPYESDGANLLAIALRIIFLIIVLILYKYCRKDSVSDNDKFYIYVYFINTILFIAVCNLSLLSRLTEYFSLLDIIIIPNLICGIKLKDIRLVSIICITLLVGVVFKKDQKSFLVEGNYLNNEVRKYPYVTIFNKDDIYKYRYVIDTYKPR